MMESMKHRIAWFALTAMSLLATPLTALAAEDDEITTPTRLEGYTSNVKLDASSTALTWLLLIFLAVICIAVLFKNAKRSHLD